VKVALAAVLDGTPTGLSSFLDFHRSVGIDVVVIGETRLSPRWASVLERYVGDGFVRRVPSSSEAELARVAVDDLGADWLIPTTPEEMWWPRGESLKDVLAVIPARYGVVQGLVRTFVGAAGVPETVNAFESRTVRTSLLGPDGSSGAPLSELLRPIYRAGPNMTLDPGDWTLGGRRVPLRAWYPVEVFRYPQSELLERDRIDAGIADNSLVIDTRLRDALAGEIRSLPVPSIVDDSSYAVECAAVGEVDLARVDQQIRDLELRIAELETRLWPTVRRTLKRITRRPS
jgi:hypothetical protein